MAKSYSVNLSVDEWKEIQNAIGFICENADDEQVDLIKKYETITSKIDKKQRAQQNLQNTITRKNKLIKSLEQEIEGLKGKIYELQNPVKEDHPDAEEKLMDAENLIEYDGKKLVVDRKYYFKLEQFYLNSEEVDQEMKDKVKKLGWSVLDDSVLNDEQDKKLNELQRKCLIQDIEELKLKEQIEGLKGKIYELQNPVKEDHPDAEE